MQINNGRLGYTLTLDNKQVQQILAQTRADFARTSEYAANELNKVQSSMSNIAVLGGSFLSIAAAKGFITQLVQVRGEFEQTEISFRTMLQSQEKSTALMSEMVELAKNTPMQFSEVTQGAKQLLAYQVEAENLTETLEMLGNISSGLSVPISRLILVYGQVRAKGRLMGDDLRQFTEAGVPMIAMIAKNMGVAQSAVADMVSEGKVGFKEVEKVLQDLTSQGGLFYNMMEEQSKTIPGQIAKLQDEIEVMFNEIGKDSQGFITSVISGASTVVENYQAIGKTIAVLVAAYGTYKAAVIVLNTIEQARLTTTLAIGAAEGRVTTMQALRYVATLKLTAAQTALNTVMMANPYAIIIAGVVALGTAYYLLSDNTTSAQRAQEAYNKTQEKVKSGLDETKKKADEYINTLKDETATVYQQIQAYNALQALKLKGLENLTQEQIATMDLTELRKLLNASYDEKGLSSQKQALVDIEKQIKSVKNQIDNANKSGASSGSVLDILYKKLEDLTGEYDLQATHVRKVEEEQKISNMTLDEQKSYYEGIVQELQNKVNEIRRVNEQQADSKNAADLVASAFAKWDISKLNFQLTEAYSKLYDIDDKLNKTIGKAYGDKNYSDWSLIRDEATQKQRDLGIGKKDTKEWQDLQKVIDGANNALKAWETTKTKSDKPKKPKTPKKSDDPVEIFKKQVQGMKDEYDRYVNYINSGDIVLLSAAEAISLRIKGKGANYEEYLRNVQKQLANVTNKTKAQVGQLQYVNDELQKVISYNAFDKYKDGINEQIDSSENLLKIIGLLQEEKQKFANSSNPIEQEKFKFLDEKEIENIKKADDAAKSLIDTLKEEFNPLDTINKKFDTEIELLKYKLEKAKDDIEKQKIVIAIEQVETKRTEALEDTPTNDKYVNEILKKYQTLEQKKQKIIDDSNREIKRMQENLQKELNKTGSVSPETITQYENVIKEIKNKQIEAVGAVDSEILKKSKGWIQIFGDYSNKSGTQLRKILDQIRTELNNPNSKLSEQDKKAYQDQFKGIKEKLEKDNPFDNLIDSFNVFKEGVKKGFKDIDGSVSLDSIRGLIGGIQGAINETLSLAEDLGINVSDSTKDAVQLGADLFNAGADIAEGIASKDPVKIIQGLAKAVKSVLNFNDKKKQRQIKRYQQAVDDLARSFKNLQYETDKALGGDTYKNQRTMLDNLTKQQEEYRKMIKTEQSRKKTDQGKIKEWQQAIIELDQSKQDLLDSLAQDILQTNAKDLANTLGDALAEAFGKGEDAAKSFEKVANDVLKNAILNQLKKEFLEKQLQGALDKLKKDMGGDDEGNFEFNGLSQEEQEKFRERLKEISKNFSGALEMYSDLFKDLEMDPNENSLSGAISGMSQETASIVAGQVNAMRLLIVEANKQRDLSNKFLMQQLDRLANIDANTRMMEPLLNKLIDKVDKLGENRSYGF